MKKNKKGFTLIELTAVVIILAIIASIALPSYKVSAMKTRIVNNMPLMRILQNDMINYYNLRGSLPTKLVQLSINKKEFSNITNTSATHTQTNCTLSLNETVLSIDCGQGWIMKYTLVSSPSSIGYSVGENTIEVTDENVSGTVKKIATGLSWPQKTGSSTIYIIK